jgi:hypothetical protein
MKPNFYSKSENQFWQDPKYTESYRERMNNLVNEWNRKNKNLSDLI